MAAPFASGWFKRRVPVETDADVLLRVGPVRVRALTDPHPLYGENYEPAFPRLSTTRRVLGHITPEVDRDDLGPRNTLHALTAGLIADPHTDISYPEEVPRFLDDLVRTGLVSVDETGVYTVTEAGWRELTN